MKTTESVVNTETTTYVLAKSFAYDPATNILDDVAWLEILETGLASKKM